MVAEPVFDARMAVGTEPVGDRQFNQLLQARRASSGISSPALRPSSSEARPTAAGEGLGVVRLVEAGVEPGKRAQSPPCQPSGWAAKQHWLSK